ncbi:MAG: hypothetical protein PHX13_10575 [Thiovulaceae bacterium]|nr:hypothetical protein [Sulfurimonadaceae bacterium]
MSSKNLENRILAQIVSVSNIKFVRSEESFFISAYLHESDRAEIALMLSNFLNDKSEIYDISVSIDSDSFSTLLAYVVDNPMFLDDIFNLKEKYLKKLQLSLNKHFEVF